MLELNDNNYYNDCSGDINFMKIAFYTLGCKVNQYETQSMTELFLKNGYLLARDGEAPDVFVINSCTVTAESDRKTRQAVRRYRRKYPDAVIVLTGCMPQAFPEDAALSLPDADIIVGNTHHAELPDLVGQFFSYRRRIVKVEKHTNNEQFNTPRITNFSEHTRAFMKIQDGCDRYCTYCIIPSARGRIRSKALADIKSEAEQLAQNGFCEIVLVGINLTSYGRDTEHNICDAVKAVAAVDGIKRIRLGSLEPDHMSDEILEQLSLEEKFCPQFHLSLQSGCDKTLSRMNRHYDTAFYYDLVCRIRKRFPFAAITTDIMVGFAGETEEEFSESLAFVKKVKFASSHIFSYSRRKGTVAYNLPAQVPNCEKERRSREMIAATAETEKEFLLSQIGLTVQVLIEREVGDGTYTGYTKNYTPVLVKSSTDICGKILNVKITGAQQGFCLGEEVQENIIES